VAEQYTATNGTRVRHKTINCMTIDTHYNVLHCTALHCTALHCTVLQYTALHCSALHCTVVHCTALHTAPQVIFIFSPSAVSPSSSRLAVVKNAFFLDIFFFSFSRFFLFFFEFMSVRTGFSDCAWTCTRLRVGTGNTAELIALLFWRRGPQLFQF